MEVIPSIVAEHKNDAPLPLVNDLIAAIKFVITHISSALFLSSRRNAVNKNPPQDECEGFSEGTMNYRELGVRRGDQLTSSNVNNFLRRVLANAENIRAA